MGHGTPRIVGSNPIRSSGVGHRGLLVLSGCAGTDAPDPQQQTTETEETSDLADDTFDVEATVTPRPGMLDVAPVGWWYDYQQGWDWGRGADDQTMLVTFPSQGAPCQVLDRIEIDETDTQVTITLYQGRDPDMDPGQPCDGPTQVVGVDVPLSRNYRPTPYSLAGITAETGEGPVINAGRLTDER